MMNYPPGYDPGNPRTEQALRKLIDNKVVEFHYKSRVQLYNDSIQNTCSIPGAGARWE